MCSYTYTHAHTHTPDKRAAPNRHRPTRIVSGFSLVKLPSHEVYQLEDSRDKIKMQKMSIYLKILKLTPESSRYLCGVGNRNSGGEGNGVAREERASIPRAGRKPYPGAHGAPRLGSEGGNQVSRPGPLLRCGYRQASRSQRSLPHHLSKELTTKEEPGRKVEEGIFKVFHVLPRKGTHPPASPLPVSETFCSDSRTRSGRSQSPDNSHSVTGVHAHLCTQIQGHGDTRSASPLPSKQPE